MIFLLLIATIQGQTLLPTLKITNTIILPDNQNEVVIDKGSLRYVYNDTTYNQWFNCKNGQLQTINATNGSNISFAYSGIPQITQNSTKIYFQPNESPAPFVSEITANSFLLQFNCPQEITNSNYFNKVNLEFIGQYNISFMLNCDTDPDHRHKTFQYGYLLIVVLNAAILVGVAVNSYIWSIHFKGKRVKITLRWFHILAACIIGVVLMAALYFFTVKSFASAFITLRYVGIAVSIFFVFICFNEIFYLFRVLKYPVFWKIRVCELLSFLCTGGVTITALLVQNWILYDMIAICICVASIKLFHFDSLKQAFLSKGIIVVTVGIMAVVIHFLVPDRSYNDYATEISSPLFIMVPDLDANLYKKCSWLVVVDIIVPGVVLAYLRLYDQNKDSKWGGVYTVWGNMTVIFATILWIGLQAVYPFSVPFSLTVYICLMLVIFLLAFKRNQWSDLYYGAFEKEHSVVDERNLAQRHESFSALVESDVMEYLKKDAESVGSSGRSGSGIHQK